jgi:hypothetical protein
MAAIWLGCAVITLAGCWIAGAIYLALRAVIRACVRVIRRLIRRRRGEFAHLVTVNADGVTAKVIDLSRYRRRNTSSPSGSIGSGAHDEPA